MLLFACSLVFIVTTGGHNFRSAVGIFEAHFVADIYFYWEKRGKYFSFFSNHSLRKTELPPLCEQSSSECSSHLEVKVLLLSPENKCYTDFATCRVGSLLLSYCVMLTRPSELHSKAEK